MIFTYSRMVLTTSFVNNYGFVNTIPAYSFAQQSTKSHLIKKKYLPVKHFKTLEQADNAIKEIAQKYKVHQNISTKYFKEYPSAFKESSLERKHLEERLKMLENMAKQHQGTIRGEIGKVFREIVFRNRVLGFNLAQQKLDRIIVTIQESGMSKEQVTKIFKTAPHAISAVFCKNFHEKCTLFNTYLGTSTKETFEIFESCPVLLTGSTKRIQSAITQLLKTYHFTQKEIQDLMKSWGEVFLFGGRIIHDLHKLPKKWGVTGPETKALFQNHPLLFFNYPYEILPLKVKLIRYLRLPSHCGRQIFLKYPSIMVYSVSSLQSKIVYLRSRLQIPEIFQFQTHSPQTLLQLLTHRFNKTLRPRIELLIKTQYPININNIVKLVELPQAQFIKQLKITQQVFNKQQRRFKNTQQMDYFNKKAFRNTKLKEKIIETVNKQYDK